MALPSQDSNVPNGAQSPATTQGEYNKIAFAIAQSVSKIKTSTLVRVDKCTNDGGLTAVGFVDVTPLVNQVDANGKGTAHTTIYGIPYLRVQGGTNAIIMDPQPGDIGICCFASRDISKVKSTKAAANPGSGREFSFSDGMYMGGMLNGLPTQYMQYSADGILIHSPTKVKITAPNVEVIADGPCSVTAGSTVTVNASGAATVNAGGTLAIHSDSAVNITAPVINLN